jgi:hypothetical protein
MTKRRRPSTPCLSKQVAILFALFEIRCGLCGERIEKPEDAEWDHIHEHADGGADTIDNIRPVHGRRTDDTLKCHQRKSARSTTHRAHIGRLETARTALANAEQRVGVKLPTEVDAGEKCRGCGNYQDGCTCAPKPERRSAFGKRPFNSAKKTEKRHVQP